MLALLVQDQPCYTVIDDENSVFGFVSPADQKVLRLNISVDQSALVELSEMVYELQCDVQDSF